MKIIKQGKLLTASSDPYDFSNDEGEQVKGVSNKVRINIEDEIFAFKIDPERVAKFKKFEGQDVTVELSLTSPKERARVQLDSVELVEE